MKMLLILLMQVKPKRFTDMATMDRLMSMAISILRRTVLSTCTELGAKFSSLIEVVISSFGIALQKLHPVLRTSMLLWDAWMKLCSFPFFEWHSININAGHPAAQPTLLHIQSGPNSKLIATYF